MQRIECNGCGLLGVLSCAQLARPEKQGLARLAARVRPAANGSRTGADADIRSPFAWDVAMESAGGKRHRAAGCAVCCAVRAPESCHSLAGERMEGALGWMDGLDGNMD